MRKKSELRSRVVEQERRAVAVECVRLSALPQRRSARSGIGLG